jgi:hypothetical protein
MCYSLWPAPLLRGNQAAVVMFIGHWLGKLIGKNILYFIFSLSLFKAMTR